MPITRTAFAAFMAIVIGSLTSCGDIPTSRAQIRQDELSQIIPAYVGEWVNLDQYFGRTIRSTSLGSETALELRVDSNGHALKCLTVKAYATVAVDFDGTTLHVYSVNCRPPLFSIRPNVGSSFNISAHYRLSTPQRNVALVEVRPGTVALVGRIGFDFLDRSVPNGDESDGGDFELICQLAAEATLHVEFAAADAAAAEDYTLVCQGGHNQGGGS